MNIIRYYNQNKKSIWIIIIAIILIIIAIQALNSIVKNQNSNRVVENTVKAEDYKNNLSVDILLSDTDVREEKELIVDQFIRYCNAKEIEKAYNLLTEDCKKNIFPTIEYFKQNYVEKIFNTKKLYSKEKFISSTYKVKLYEDILSTGNIDTSTVEDYYTIEKEDGKTKLNISNYIGYKQINTTSKGNIIEVKVIGKNVYKEYEEYELEVSNLTNKTILLDSKENTRTMYLTGKNNVKYYALSHELLQDELMLKPKMTKVVFIKFTKEYNSNTTINDLIFSDIIKDYELYNTKESKREYLDRDKITINL